MLGKSGYFDQSYAVPLIIRDPRTSADAARGKTITAFTEHVDIMPTLLDFAGADIPPQCDGRSLMPFVETGSAPTWRTEAHWEYDFRDASFDGPEKDLGLTLHQCNLTVIRDENYKYIHFAALPPLLFDMKNDPGEFTNLANAANHKPTVLRYAQKLLSWRLTHEDQTLTHKMATDKGMIERASPRF
jgi:arylsulfatase A-like enzyme